MSVGKSENRFHEILETSYPNYLEKETGISKAIIPFSKMFQSHKPTDVYCGKEKIPNQKYQYGKHNCEKSSTFFHYFLLTLQHKKYILGVRFPIQPT